MAAGLELTGLALAGLLNRGPLFLAGAEER